MSSASGRRPARRLSAARLGQRRQQARPRARRWCRRARARRSAPPAPAPPNRSPMPATNGSVRGHVGERPEGPGIEQRLGTLPRAQAENVAGAHVPSYYASGDHKPSPPSRTARGHAVARRLERSDGSLRGAQAMLDATHVPSPHEVRYSRCSGRQAIDLDAHAVELQRRHRRPRSPWARRAPSRPGRRCGSSRSAHSALSAWVAKLMSITAAGCPSAAARLTRRPSPMT